MWWKFFLKVPKNARFSAQNVLDPLLSLHIYFFIPKVLLKDQKMLNLRRMKMIKEGLPTSVLLCTKLAILHIHTYETLRHNTLSPYSCWCSLCNKSSFTTILNYIMSNVCSKNLFLIYFWSLDLLEAIQGIAFCVVLAFSFLSLHFVPFTQILQNFILQFRTSLDMFENHMNCNSLYHI